MNSIIQREQSYIPQQYGSYTPQDIPSLTISGTGTLALDNLTLYISGETSAAIDLHGQSVSQVASQINSQVNGVTATVLQDGPAELLLYPDGYGEPPSGSLPATLTIATNPLWQLLVMGARELATTSRTAESSISQLNLRAAIGLYLEWWGESLGIARYPGEPDSLYVIRLAGMTAAPNVNNMAMEVLFSALGYSVSCADSGPGQLNVTAQMQLANRPEGFAYSTSQLIDITNQMKAAGVIVTFCTLQYVPIDKAAAFDNGINVLTVTPGTGSIWGDGDKWGQGYWMPPAVYGPPKAFEAASEGPRGRDNITPAILTPPLLWGVGKWGQN